jgi:hypothetical protein
LAPEQKKNNKTKKNPTITYRTKNLIWIDDSQEKLLGRRRSETLIFIYFYFFHFWLDSSLYIQTYGWRAVAQMSGHAMLLPCCCCCCCCYENPLIITRSCNCLKLKWSHQEFEFHPPAKWELDLYFCKNRRAKAGGPCQQRERFCSRKTCIQVANTHSTRCNTSLNWLRERRRPRRTTVGYPVAKGKLPLTPEAKSIHLLSQSPPKRERERRKNRK